MSSTQSTRQRNSSSSRYVQPSGLPHGLKELLSSPILSSAQTRQLGIKRRRATRCALNSSTAMPRENQENLDPLTTAGDNANVFRSVLGSPSVLHSLLKEKLTISNSNTGFALCSDNQVPRFHCKRLVDGDGSTVSSTNPTKKLKSNPELFGIKPPAYPRCHSETEIIIKSALNRADERQDLIGDFSKPYSLPLVRSRHHDLKAISSKMVWLKLS